MRLGLLLLLAAPLVSEGANILCPIWFVAPSHFVMFERLFKELAARGHNVTVISHFPQKTPVPNYHDISIAGSSPLAVDNITMDIVKFVRNPVVGPSFFWYISIDLCRTVYSLPQVQELIESGQHYDLVIAEIFFSDCMASLAHKFRAPLVGVISSMALPWVHDRVGNPDHPAYTEEYLVPFAAPFTIWQRVYNTVSHVALRLGKRLEEWAGSTVERRHLGEDTPPLADSTSLVLVNSHWSFNQPVPTVPAFVEVGGLHVQEPRPLPQDLQTYLDESPHGVVYFSLGSMVRCDSFDADKLQALLDVFAFLPQRVLWKINPDTVPELPSNVRAIRRAPQNDVLNHPNVRLFITHAGLMGTQEAVQAGVPMLAIPMFYDQFVNAARIAALGNGLQLQYEDITYESLRRSLDALLNDTRYLARARELSVLFRDRPRSPLEEAVHWVEYVLRHGGAPHLRSAAVHLSWHQHLLLDVAAFLLAVVSAALVLLFLVARRLRAFFKPPVASKLKTN